MSARQGDRLLVPDYKRFDPFNNKVLTTESIESWLERIPRTMWIAVNVDPLWGGDYDDLRRVRNADRVDILGILAKGLDVDPDRAQFYGANKVLTYDIEKGVENSDYVVEVHETEDIKRAINNRVLNLLVNNRDIRTGEFRTDSQRNQGYGWTHASESAAAMLERYEADEITFWAASGYTHPHDAPDRADFVVVGTALLS